MVSTFFFNLVIKLLFDITRNALLYKHYTSIFELLVMHVTFQFA